MMFTCGNCQDRFHLPREDKRVKYCSEACQKAYKRKPTWKATCKKCKVVFETNMPQQVFCSFSCKRTWEMKQYQLVHDQYKKKCPHCFRWFQTTNNRKTYCSIFCYEETKRERNHVKYWKKKRESYLAPVPGFE